MTKKIFYWTKSKYLIPKLEETKEVDKQDFKELPVTFTDEISDEEIFKLLNQDNSPLSTPENQKWIKENLNPDPHTSMSVGDIIEYDNKLIMCDHDGWTEVKWKNT